MTITFEKIVKCYGREPKSISEFWSPRIGWQIAVIDPSAKAIKALAKQGAVVFNFLVVDETGQTHYADFKLSELTK